MPKFGIKNVLGIFGIELQKNYCHILDRQPQICLTAKFREKKQKCLNLRPKMLYLGITGLQFENRIVIF